MDRTVVGTVAPVRRSEGEDDCEDVECSYDVPSHLDDLSVASWCPLHLKGGTF